MIFKKGDIVLIRFPFTDLNSSKQRPALISSQPNSYGDFQCFQITSQSKQSQVIEVTSESLESGELKLKSFLKFDKCFTLNSSIINKRVATVNKAFLNRVLDNFCNILRD